MTTDGVAIIQKLIDGDISAVDRVACWDESDFADVSRSHGFVVRATGVVTVLQAFQTGRATQQQAQIWGDFAMHGFIPGVVPRPLTSLDVKYDTSNEDAIAIAVMRLSELGDIVDGEFRPGEIDQLVASLESPET